MPLRSRPLHPTRPSRLAQCEVCRAIQGTVNVSDKWNPHAIPHQHRSLAMLVAQTTRPDTQTHTLSLSSYLSLRARSQIVCTPRPVWWSVCTTTQPICIFDVARTCRGGRRRSLPSPLRLTTAPARAPPVHSIHRPPNTDSIAG